jgi:hypothetical protein
VNRLAREPTRLDSSVRSVAGVLLGFHGVLVLLEALFGAPNAGGDTSWEVALASLHLLVAWVVAASLMTSRAWAWWGALALTLLGLFFLLPVAMGIVFGGGSDFALDMWSRALVLGSTLTLAALFVILFTHRRVWTHTARMRARSGRDRA